MKYILALLVITCSLASVGQETQQLKKVLELKIPREGGARAAAVAWHPVLKRYYAAMAGNAIFCMGVFDAKGTRLSTPAQETKFDVRGLWFNPTTKTLQMNGYNDFGWAEYKLDPKGFPASVKVLFPGMNQPGEHCSGAFDPKKNIVYFLNEDGNIDIYSLKDGSYFDDIELHLGVTSGNDDGTGDNADVMENYNSTTVVFTGLKTMELGVLNIEKKQVELYNADGGHLTKILQLPDNAPAEDILCFSYANGIYWLFDREARVWLGYK